jgi:hypothetical protein
VSIIVYHCLSLSIIVYHCLSLSIMVYHCLSLSFIVYHCLSLSIIVYHCLSFSFIVYQCLSLSVSVYRSLFFSFIVYHCLSIYLSIYLCLQQFSGCGRGLSGLVGRHVVEGLQRTCWPGDKFRQVVRLWEVSMQGMQMSVVSSSDTCLTMCKTYWLP